MQGTPTHMLGGERVWHGGTVVGGQVQGQYNMQGETYDKVSRYDQNRNRTQAPGALKEITRIGV